MRGCLAPTSRRWGDEQDLQGSALAVEAVAFRLPMISAMKLR